MQSVFNFLFIHELHVHFANWKIEERTEIKCGTQAKPTSLDLLRDKEFNVTLALSLVIIQFQSWFFYKHVALYSHAAHTLWIWYNEFIMNSIVFL